MILTKDMKVNIKFPSYSRKADDRFEEGVVTKVGRKYAHIQIGNLKEHKFNKIVFEEPGDNESVDTEFYHYMIIDSVDDYIQKQKETEVVQNFISKALTGKIRPTYEQVLKICEILNLEV